MYTNACAYAAILSPVDLKLIKNALKNQLNHTPMYYYNPSITDWIKDTWKNKRESIQLLLLCSKNKPKQADWSSLNRQIGTES